MSNTPNPQWKLPKLFYVIYLIAMISFFLSHLYKKHENVFQSIALVMYLMIVILLIAGIKDKHDKKQLLWMIGKYVLIGGSIAVAFYLAGQF